MFGLIFKPRATSFPQGPLSPSVKQPEHPVRQYLTKGASEWHFTAKIGHFCTKVQILKSQKLIFYGERMTWHVGPSNLRPSSTWYEMKLWFKFLSLN